MNKKIWLDDVRAPPDDTWKWVKDSKSFVYEVMVNYPDTISLDHDLGGKTTGFDLMKWLFYCGFWPKTVLIHSMNPVGAQRMKQFLDDVINKKVESFFNYKS